MTQLTKLAISGKGDVSDRPADRNHPTRAFGALLCRGPVHLLEVIAQLGPTANPALFGI